LRLLGTHAGTRTGTIWVSTYVIIVSAALFILLIDSGVSELNIALTMIEAVISIISSDRSTSRFWSARSSHRTAKRNESRITRSA
jgi:hypothetical protein